VMTAIMSAAMDVPRHASERLFAEMEFLKLVKNATLAQATVMPARV